MRTLFPDLKLQSRWAHAQYLQRLKCDSLITAKPLHTVATYNMTLLPLRPE